MNPSQLLTYIKNVSGVEGCYLANADGEIIHREAPPLFDDESLSAIAVNASHILETFKAGMNDCNAVQLNMELKKLFVRQLDANSLLVVFIAAGERLENIKIAANVASKRYQPAHVPLAKAIAEPPEATTSIFGARIKRKEKPQPKPDSSGGGIWG